MTIQLSNLGLWGHRVTCDRCGTNEVHAQFPDALREYRDHYCPNARPLPLKTEAYRGKA